MDVHAVSGRAGCYYILCGCRAVCVEPFTGMGGRDFASHTLKKLEDNLDKNSDKEE